MIQLTKVVLVLVRTLIAVPPLFGAGGRGGSLVEEVSRRLAAAAGRTRLQKRGGVAACLHLNDTHRWLVSAEGLWASTVVTTVTSHLSSPPPEQQVGGCDVVVLHL